MDSDREDLEIIWEIGSLLLDDFGQDSCSPCLVFHIHRGHQPSWRTLRCEVPTTEHFFRLILTSCFSFLSGELTDNDTGAGACKEGTGQRYPHPRNISVIFSCFENYSFFYSQLVKMVAPGSVLRDRDQTVQIRIKKMFENFRFQKCIPMQRDKTYWEWKSSVIM